ncbi:MAG TPA: hypothetical protein VL977_06795 [Solirubrobacteraceae bacterium]|nr:hypothetical protein [Solirubrobacteraceae bacterium]
MSCPGCAAAVGEGREWCVRCGAALRTRVAPTPRWRAGGALALLAAVAVLCAVILVLAGGPAGSSAAPATDASGATAATGAS